MSILTEQRSYLAGRWVTGDEALEVEDPTTEETVAEITAKPITEVRTAITRLSAGSTRPIGPTRPATERADVLWTFLDHLQSQRNTIMATLMAEAGQPPSMADMTQMTGGVTLGRTAIDLICR